MKFISLDIETSGLNPERHQVLELAMVLEDTEYVMPLQDLPFFNQRISYEEVTGSPFALAMNHQLIKDMHYPCAVPLATAVENAWQWLYDVLDHVPVGTNMPFVTVAGKNVGTFDIPFLKANGFEALTEMFHRRTLDAGSALFKYNKPFLPSLGDLIPPGRKVQHTAYQDALDVIEVLRKKYA